MSPNLITPLLQPFIRGVDVSQHALRSPARIVNTIFDLKVMTVVVSFKEVFGVIIIAIYNHGNFSYLY